MATEHDREILNHVFNPLLPLTTQIVEDEFPEEQEPTPCIIDEAENTALSRALEVKGLKAAEMSEFEEAIELFSASISAMPLRPSPFNNRAQTYRLKGQIEQAKLDLDRALELCNGKGPTGRQALCQRALIALKENRQSEAKIDLEAAAKLGSQFAKAQLVQMNPYAALCNRMLRDVMDKMSRGESEYYEETNNKIGQKQ